MKGKKTKAYLCELIKEKNIPYLDILVKKEHKTVLRCYDSREKKATGKENIFLFSTINYHSPPLNELVTTLYEVELLFPLKFQIKHLRR